MTRAKEPKAWHESARRKLRQPAGFAYVLVLLIFAEPVLGLLIPGTVLVAAGVLVRLWAAGFLRKSQDVEMRGPYAFVRHPQYLGNCLIAVGLALASGFPLAIAVWVLIYAATYPPAMAREDRKIEGRFGERWRRWKESTPAVLPSRLPGRQAGPYFSDWSPRRALLNGEPVWALLVAAVVGSMWVRVVL